MDVPVFAVDYGNVDSIASVLEANDIHTVISTLAVRGPDESAAELGLVKAAVKATPTMRFIASEFGTMAPTDE
jgi:hypothetical protein